MALYFCVPFRELLGYYGNDEILGGFGDNLRCLLLWMKLWPQPTRYSMKCLGRFFSNFDLFCLEYLKYVVTNGHFISSVRCVVGLHVLLKFLSV
ncbi:unnamed protein product [Lactuca virosa]|uniref:Uncharacterized protein n=1 Tax=Lactuca virosa TaxID=75947 RepID=A0AAU9M191_9ASTR|nr:unnamed protein product [Lactuca virosa]